MVKRLAAGACATLAVFAAIFCIRAIVTRGGSSAGIETDRDYANSSGTLAYEDSTASSLTEEFVIPTEVTVPDSNTFLIEDNTSALFTTGIAGDPASRSSSAANITQSGRVTPSTSATVPGSVLTTVAGSTASSTAASTAKPSTPAGTTKAPATLSDYEYSYAGFNPQPANLNEADWTLILVNRDYILPEGYVPPELVPSVKSDPDSKKLDSRVAPHYNDMYLAAKKDGIILETVSGYRSYSLQRNNFENKISKYINQGMNRTKATQEAAKIILPPGTSEHNLGFAMDICSLEQNFERSDEFKWLCEHAADYGFILRYPKDKQDVTKIIYEPWHWRYVGVENAKIIKDSGKCLEEYLNKA